MMDRLREGLVKKLYRAVDKDKGPKNEVAFRF